MNFHQIRIKLREQVPVPTAGAAAVVHALPRSFPPPCPSSFVLLFLFLCYVRHVPVGCRESLIQTLSAFVGRMLFHYGIAARALSAARRTLQVPAQGPASPPALLMPLASATSAFGKIHYFAAPPVLGTGARATSAQHALTAPAHVRTAARVCRCPPRPALCAGTLPAGL